MFRQLNEVEMGLVAGGDSNVIVVTGTRHTSSYSTQQTTYNDLGGSDSREQPDYEDIEDPNDTPCVETEFESGADQHLVNTAALAASNSIAALNDERYEYSSIVWTLGGEVGYTDPYTDNRPDKINFLGGLSDVPNGATIVGVVHNHPDQAGVDDRYPSGVGSDRGDWDAYAQMQALDLPRGIDFDPNMLLYIYTNEDGNVRVYDNTDQRNRTQCAL